MFTILFVHQIRVTCSQWYNKFHSHTHAYSVWMQTATYAVVLICVNIDVDNMYFYMHTSWNEGGQDYELCVSCALWEQWACMCGAFLSFCRRRKNSAKKEKLSVHERWSTRCMLNVEWETAFLTIIITYYDDNHFLHSNFYICSYLQWHHRERARTHKTQSLPININHRNSHVFTISIATFLCAFASLNRCKCRCALCVCGCTIADAGCLWTDCTQSRDNVQMFRK